jgi:glycosyltransferase involved in cell wall biosynthesis
LNWFLENPSFHQLENLMVVNEHSPLPSFANLFLKLLIVLTIKFLRLPSRSQEYLVLSYLRIQNPLFILKITNIIITLHFPTRSLPIPPRFQDFNFLPLPLHHFLLQVIVFLDRFHLNISPIPLYHSFLAAKLIFLSISNFCPFSTFMPFLPILFSILRPPHHHSIQKPTFLPADFPLHPLDHFLRLLDGIPPIIFLRLWLNYLLLVRVVSIISGWKEYSRFECFLTKPKFDLRQGS